jgi:site-specific DNA recombinase
MDPGGGDCLPVWPVYPIPVCVGVQDVMREKGRHRSHQQKHNCAFQGMLSCGHCGCAMVAEIKKNRYVYYHCTKNRGKCLEKWVREEEVARQFGRTISDIKIEKEVLDWVITVLKESHANEMKYHMETINTLKTQSDKIQRRLSGKTAMMLIPSG